MTFAMTTSKLLPHFDHLGLNSHSIPILLVDDEIVAIRSMELATKAQNVTNTIAVAHDGEQALQLLRNWLGERRSLPPILILLDLNMPRMTGLEFLAEIRRDPVLKRALVFVHSTSDRPSDVEAAYNLNVAGFISKQGQSVDVSNAITMLDSFASTVVFPGSAQSFA